ncbi:MAG TPA: stage V sporulation protein AE, partial [Clostridiales bacterium]|nr:stage V sporulation protein AE [Clostridiales bacterium]
VYFMLAGVILQAAGVYKYLVDFAGAGATVPISGFGYLLADGAIEGAKQGLFEAVTGGLSSASAGVTAAVTFSFLSSLIFKPKSKNN